MGKSLLPDAVDLYIDHTFHHEDEVLRRLREETGQMPQGGMQITAAQGKFLDILIRSLGASRVLEVGVFTGYSSVAMAMALPHDGTLVACDVSVEFTNVAKRYWEEARVAHKVTLHIGPALDTLDSLLADKAVFDFCFIDADKPNYANYWERAVQLVRPGGMIAVDNTLWSGKVTDTDVVDEETVAIRQLNELAAKDSRVITTLVPIGDGMTLATKL